MPVLFGGVRLVDLDVRLDAIAEEFFVTRIELTKLLLLGIEPSK